MVFAACGLAAVERDDQLRAPGFESLSPLAAEGFQPTPIS